MRLSFCTVDSEMSPWIMIVFRIRLAALMATFSGVGSIALVTFVAPEIPAVLSWCRPSITSSNATSNILVGFIALPTLPTPMAALGPVDSVALPTLVALMIPAAISWCGFSIANGNATSNVFVAFVSRFSLFPLFPLLWLLLVLWVLLLF